MSSSNSAQIIFVPATGTTVTVSVFEKDGSSAAPTYSDASLSTTTANTKSISARTVFYVPGERSYVVNTGAGNSAAIGLRSGQSMTFEVASPVALVGASTTTAPGSGAAGGLPAAPAGYLTVTINGTARQIPYY